MFAVGIAPTPQAKMAVGGAVGSVIATFDQFRSSSSYINFHERRHEPRARCTRGPSTSG